MVQFPMPQPPIRTGPIPPALRDTIRRSDESIRTLAARHGLNPKTVAKWRTRTDIADRKRGPATPGSRAITAADEAAILAFRRYIPLSLDDSMATLGARLPALSRSTLHRLLKRHGLSRPPGREIFALPDAASRPGCFHIDIVPVATGGDRHYLFFAVEQSSALIFALLRPDATQATARDFLNVLADGSPAPVRLVLTSDRFQFTTPGNSMSGAADVREALEKGTLAHAHPFEYACAARGIDHHIVPNHFPWDDQFADTIGAATAGILAMAAPDEVIAQQSLHAELARHNDCPLPSLGGLSPGNWLAAAEGARTMEPWDENQRETPPSPRPVRRETNRRDSTREAILEAAHNRLAHDGPEGLSLSEVARLAGVNRGTAYQHFKTRSGLIAATGRWMAEKLHRAVFTGPSSGMDMGSIAKRLAGFAMDNPLLCRAWLLRLLSSPDPEADIFWHDYRAAMTTLAPKGADTAMDREVASVAMLAGAFLWPALAGASTMPPPSDATDTVARFAREWLRILHPTQ